MRTYQWGNRFTIYHADCVEVLDKINTHAIVLTDPPYGIGYKVNARSWQNEGLDSLRPFKMEKRPAIEGDDRAFDTSRLVLFPKAAIFGANHMEGLPPGGRWIVWDKRRDSTPDDHPDCEMIWTNVKGPDRIHRQKWRGIVREGEENTSRSKKLHPNQKPVALLDFILTQLGAQIGDTVLDPYMGSGSTGVAALRRGMNFIGIECDEEYYEIAHKRMLEEVPI